ncbi:unnamed protein product [Protopolystoma xenopodis]|uniref:Uncharacterized protein n=1 Tax=Protopolystoma xenopodis TaxID=117903 RepID=A0A3S4ZWK8_9PLAT|nr:unnamed protein product [Protopolystoma xenopodis]
MGSRTGHLFPNDKVITRLRISRARIAHQLGSRDALACVWHSGYSRAPRSPRYLADYVLEPMRAQLYPIGQADKKYFDASEFESAQRLNFVLTQHLVVAQIPWDGSAQHITSYNYNSGLEHAASRLLPGQVAKHYEVLLSEFNTLLKSIIFVFVTSIVFAALTNDQCIDESSPKPIKEF